MACKQMRPVQWFISVLAVGGVLACQLLSPTRACLAEERAPGTARPPLVPETMTAADRGVYEALKDKVTLGFDKTPLPVVVEFLRQTTRVKYTLFEQDLPPDQGPVTLTTTTTVEDALNRICEQTGLAWKVTAGQVKIGSRWTLATWYSRVYNVGDLLANTGSPLPPGVRGRAAVLEALEAQGSAPAAALSDRAAALVLLIKQACGEGSWETPDGAATPAEAGSLGGLVGRGFGGAPAMGALEAASGRAARKSGPRGRAFVTEEEPGALAVIQTAEVHKCIEYLLRELRGIMPIQIDLEVQGLVLDPNQVPAIQTLLAGAPVAGTLWSGRERCTLANGSTVRLERLRGVVAGPVVSADRRLVLLEVMSEPGLETLSGQRIEGDTAGRHTWRTLSLRDGESGLVLVEGDPARQLARLWMASPASGAAPVTDCVVVLVFTTRLIGRSPDARPVGPSVPMPPDQVARPEANASGQVEGAARADGSPSRATSVEPPWNRSPEGIQVRMWPRKALWRSDEVPTLRADLNNLSGRAFLISVSQQGCELEVDGRWCRWAGAEREKVERRRMVPGAHHDGVPFALDGHWTTTPGGTTLRLTEGKHSVRVAFICDPVAGGPPVRAESFAVAIEIRAPAPPLPAQADPPRFAAEMSLAEKAADDESKVAHLRNALRFRPDDPANIAIEYEMASRIHGSIVNPRYEGGKRDEARAILQGIRTRYRHMDYYSREGTSSPWSPEVQVPYAALLEANWFADGAEAAPLYEFVMLKLRETIERRRQDWLNTPKPTFNSAFDREDKWQGRVQDWERRRQNAAAGVVLTVEESRLASQAIWGCLERVAPERAPEALDRLLAGFPDGESQRALREVVAWFPTAPATQLAAEYLRAHATADPPEP